MLPSQQDQYLAEGYFRTGHSLRQTRFVFVDGQMYSTVWSRVPLQAVQFSKSQRKLKRRVEGAYTIRCGPYVEKDDQDELYYRYQSEHPLDVGESVPEILGHHFPLMQFDTYCLRIEEFGRLIAFSCFDIGESSIASIFGCYEPRRSRESLGFATMLLEIDFARYQGARYYYPGYCVPGLAPFGYKLRLPNLQGRTFADQEWEQMHQVLARPLPKHRIEQKLAALSAQLQTRGMAARLVTMPLAENYFNHTSSSGPMPHTLMLSVESAVPLGEIYVGYDLLKQQYEMWLASLQSDLRKESLMPELFRDFPEDAELTLFNWRIPVYATPDITALLKVLRPGSMLARIFPSNLDD